MSLVFQPNNRIYDCLTGILDGRPDRLRLASPWASEGALDSLCSAWSAAPGWATASRQAIIGISAGITPATVFEVLAGHGFQVRIPTAEEILNSRDLRPSVLNHVKVVCASNAADDAFQLVAGSANLTDAGLGLSTAPNLEAANKLVGSTPADAQAVLRPFDEWWDIAWESATEATDGILRQYEELRSQLPRPADEHRLPAERPDDFLTMWIEVPASAVSGGAGSQVDVPNQAARRFFGVVPGAPYRERIEIRYGSRSRDKIVDWRGAAGLNQQLRLNLLTENQGGPPSYRDKILVIHRLSSAPLVLLTEVVEPGNARADSLRRQSEARGLLFQTLPGHAGSREWGLIR